MQIAQWVAAQAAAHTTPLPLIPALCTGEVASSMSMGHHESCATCARAVAEAQAPALMDWRAQAAARVCKPVGTWQSSQRQGPNVTRVHPVCHGQSTGWRRRPRWQSPAPTIGRVRAWVALAARAGGVLTSCCGARSVRTSPGCFFVSWCHGAIVAAPQCTHLDLREGAEGARASESVIGCEAAARGQAWRAASAGRGARLPGALAGLAASLENDEQP